MCSTNELYIQSQHTFSIYVLHYFAQQYGLQVNLELPSSYFTKSKVVPMYTVRELDSLTHSPNHL